MTRYIDESKIKFTGDTYTDENKDVYIKLSDVRQAIAQTPAADVVEVVRCKDCKHLYSDEKVNVCVKKGMILSVFDADITKHFCSYGERKIND